MFISKRTSDLKTVKIFDFIPPSGTALKKKLHKPGSKRPTQRKNPHTGITVQKRGLKVVKNRISRLEVVKTFGKKV
jgi:hypothetical protein